MRGNEANRVISVSQGGLYHCRGGRGDPVYYTEDSAPVMIVQAVVKVQQSWSQMFTGETITLKCEIKEGENREMKYEWKLPRRNTPNTNSPPTSSEYRISRVSVSHSGDYRCRGSSDYLLTGWSDAFTLTVSSSKPRATLTAQSSVIPAGGSVTLSCSVEGSAGWKFDWFRRDSVSSKAQLMRGNEANRVISVSQGGLYHCRGGRGDPVYYTEDSQEIQINTTGFSSPVWLMVGLVCGVSLIIIYTHFNVTFEFIVFISCFRSIQSESHSPGSSTNHGVNQNETHEFNSLHPGQHLNRSLLSLLILTFHSVSINRNIS
uniref:Ig-like domain-containing protein n=1 Tax=Oreochromis niloticus TaxID=8128 RepID=A0A669BED6_ORENI